MARKSRGRYAGLICLRCRARKIKCVLPPGAARSDQPQPPETQCQRCKQHGFDCVVDNTTLGRPATKRAVEGEPVDASGFILAQPYDTERSGLPVREVCEALSSPILLMHAMLARYEDFASQLPAPPPTMGGEVIPNDVVDLLDHHLAWHRICFPYIPTLASLQATQTSPARSLLFALLCDIALDVPARALDAHRHLQKPLHSLVFHFGQTVLFRPPNQHETVIAMELLAEYRPLALVHSRPAAAAALSNGLYSLVAKRVAQRIGLGESALDCLQWINLLTAELEAAVPLWQPQLLVTYLAETEPLLATLQQHLDAGTLPSVGEALYHLHTINIRAMRTYIALPGAWRDVQRLSAIIQQHEADGTQHRPAFAHLEAVPLLDAEMHRAHQNVLGRAMFYAVMASAYPRPEADFAPSEVVQISDHIIHRLRAQPADDPHPHPVRTFLETYGHTRLTELERVLTNFIALVEASTLRGVPFVGPLRHTAAGLLTTCKEIVEDNASRLKGWGGMDDRVDVQLILIQESARKLESMTAPASRDGAVGQGDVLAATAKLVRSLHSILAGWRKKLADQSRAPMEPPAVVEPQQDLMLENDFFVDWDNWPQFETADFAEFFKAEIEVGWLMV